MIYDQWFLICARIHYTTGKSLDPIWTEASIWRLTSGLQADLPRVWNSSPPIVVTIVSIIAAVVIIASISAVVSKTVGIADSS